MDDTNHQSWAVVFTDVVRSTELNDTLTDRVMSAAWVAHDAATRALLRAFRGREIGRTDGFLVLFASTDDAVEFALAYHRALEELPVRLSARVGVHFGPVTVRENSATDTEQGATRFEAAGLAVPLAARVMSTASGGQTLLTVAAVRALVHAPLRLQSHGHWRFKGVLEPTELFETGTGDAAFTPPADSVNAYCVVRVGDLWVPRRAVPHTLPAERDRFVGRERELQYLADTLREGVARLVTIVGTGGMGKTRLALRFGWSWLGEFPGGVWFCNLAPAHTFDGLVQATAAGLDVPLGAADPVLQLANAIAGRGTCLVILDNFEHLTEHAEATLGIWLDRAPEARFLVTSQGRLGVRGESMLTLGSLDVEEAIALFVQRARSVLHTISYSPDELRVVAALVALLDALPLAIELAASRASTLAPEALLAAMDQRFRVLATRSGASGRHATLRATLDWSWELLSGLEKQALGTLSVFAGGFTLEAAGAVLALPDRDVWVPDVVQRLVDRSMVQSLDGKRFDLLSSVREYAAEHLAARGSFDGSGPAAKLAAETRHGRYYAGLSESRITADGAAEMPDVIAACERAAERGDAAVAISTLLGAWSALKLRGPFRAILDLTERVARLPFLAPSDLAVVGWVAGEALTFMGQIDAARARLDEALTQAVSAGDVVREALLRHAKGESLLLMGDVAAAKHELPLAAALADRLQDPLLRCQTSNGLGTLARYESNPGGAREHYGQALALARQLGHRRWIGGVLGNLALLDYEDGHFERARDRVGEAVALAHEIGDRRWEGNARCNLGLFLNELGQPEAARSELETALAMARAMGHRRLECTALANLGLVHGALGEHETAIRYHHDAQELAKVLGDVSARAQSLGQMARLQARVAKFDRASQALDEAFAILAEQNDIVTRGLVQCARAEVARLRGDAQGAVEALRDARALCEMAGASPGSELARAIAAEERAVSCPC